MLTIRILRQFRYAAIALVLLTAAIRLPSLVHPQPIDDETGYSVVANEIVDGGRPYLDAIERKPPLLLWVYAAVFKAAGKYNWYALHAVALSWTLATMAGLYVIGRGLFDRETGLIAALFYSIFQPWVLWKNLAFNGELLMNLPIVWACAIAFVRSSSRIRPELFVVGVLLGAGFLLKQPAIFAAVPLILYLILPSYRTSRNLTWSESVTQVTILTTGFLAALGLVTIVLRAQGILREAFYWTITNHTDLHIFWQFGILFTLAFAGACLPLLIGPAMAYRDTDGVWAGHTAERTALWMLLGASALGVAVGGRFYEHYYIQLIPPLVLLAAPYYARIWSGAIQPPHWLLRPTVTYSWLATTVVAFAIAHWIALTLEREPSQAGRYLSEHSPPACRIFVWGQKPQIYLDARRRPASRYILTASLTGYYRYRDLASHNRIDPEVWTALEQDLRKHPAAYIVDLHADADAQYPVQNFPFLAKLVTEQYQPVARTAEGIIYRLRSKEERP